MMVVFRSAKERALSRSERRPSDTFSRNDPKYAILEQTSVMAVRIKKGRALSTLSLTPLIDVVFLLLIFFLVATRFAEEDRELDVLLPSASEAKPMTMQPKELLINIDHKGRYFIGHKMLGTDEIEHALQRAVADNPANQSVIIRSDKRVQLDYVVFVLNACNKAGIYDYSLTTEAKRG
jgi:biopolymer transport protein ExbD